MEAVSPRRGRTLIRVAVVLVAAAGLLLLGILLGGGDLTDALDDLVTLLLALAVVAALAGWAHERRAAQVRAGLEEQRRGRMDERARAGDDRADLLERQLREQREALHHEQRLRLRVE